MPKNSNSLYNIIDEDRDIIVIHKMPGVAVETKKIGEIDLVSALRNYVHAKDGNTYIGIVHRLDQPVEGLMVVAKNPKAAAFLSSQVSGANGRMEKIYHARVYGQIAEEEGQLTDWLVKDGRTNLQSVVDEAFAKSDKGKASKKAVLDYRVIERQEYSELLEIKLGTGRHHQIRVQLANAGVPILGDTKYGSSESIDYSRQQGIKQLALKSVRLGFVHPGNDKYVKYSIEI